jgi:hypothetical protein
MITTSPISEAPGTGGVFGETPKTAVETTALPKATEVRWLFLLLGEKVGMRASLG